MTSKCDNVISLKQYGPTCWFNSILMALLYSDESRKLLLKKSKEWNKKIEVLNTINYILHHKYLRTDKAFKDYEYFDKIRPEYILKELYKYNNKKFIIDPDVNKHGYKSALYIRKIYKLLGVKVLYLDLDLKTKNIYYSIYNNIKVVSFDGTKINMQINIKNQSTINKYLNDPDVIIINTKPFEIKTYPYWYKINNNASYENYADLAKFANLNYEITNNKNIYKQDSVLLTDYNSVVGGHSIAGITCRKDRYVYNGWTRTTIDPNLKKNTVKADFQKHINIPCELMKFNWNVKTDKEFCLNRKKCILDAMDINQLCFSFNKGDREVIYVKKQKTTTLNQPDKECPEGKILNPLTNKCINIKTINKVPKNTLSLPEKECPDGKILNPLTNRCIKIKNDPLAEKECPDGKILNPLTNRCINIKNINKVPKNTLGLPEKECPDGKILNPLTNRCIKIKNTDGINYVKLYEKTIASFPTKYKVYIDIPYSNKEDAKEIGARWDPIKKLWYYTEETKLGEIFKLNNLAKIKPTKITIDIPFLCKDDIKKLGLYWDANIKKWYYFSNLPEINIAILEKYEWECLCNKKLGK